MKNKILLVFLLCIGCPAYATNINGFVGTSAGYFLINDSKFEYVNNSDEFKISGINVGLNYILDKEQPLLISFSTNRLLPSKYNQKVINKINHKSFQNTTIITTDSIAVGYLFGKISPMLFIANTQVDKSLHQNNTFIAKTKQSALLYGLNVNYSYDKNLSFSTAIIAPNQELNLESGIVLGINYNFNL